MQKKPPQKTPINNKVNFVTVKYKVCISKTATGQNQPSDVGKKISCNWYGLNSGRHIALLGATQRLQGNHWKENLQATVNISCDCGFIYIFMFSIPSKIYSDSNI